MNDRGVLGLEKPRRGCAFNGDQRIRRRWDKNDVQDKIKYLCALICFFILSSVSVYANLFPKHSSSIFSLRRFMIDICTVPT